FAFHSYPSGRHPYPGLDPTYMYHLLALSAAREPPRFPVIFTACAPSGTIDQLSPAAVARTGHFPPAARYTQKPEPIGLVTAIRSRVGGSPRREPRGRVSE